MQAQKLDQKARHLALDTNTSFIVQAPAGSGKTELLIQRFLALLATVKKPEEILSITFTKKAANEMRTRVIKALNQAYTQPEPESLHHKKTWLLAKKVLERDALFSWNLVNNPNQLRIQTIDSLCAYLTKQLPLLSHFGAQPDIASSPDNLYRLAVKEILLHVEQDFPWSNDISKLLLHFDNDLNRVHDLLMSLLAKRDQWLSYIQLQRDDEGIKAQLETHLSSVISSALSTAKSLFPAECVTELLTIVRFAADQLITQNSRSEIVACRNLITLPPTLHHALPQWRGLAQLLLTKNFAWRKRIDEDLGFKTRKNITNPNEKIAHAKFRQRLQDLILHLKDHEELRIALTELFFLPASTYQPEQWEILQALLHVLKIVAAQLRVTFQQYGQIDFIENMQAALLALGSNENPTDLALTLDYQIQHILVDEFQDTSYAQYQLLEKLTLGWQQNDGRTLFVVGDPMQSIYRFREAEVGLFLKLRDEGIGNLHLQSLVLCVNFRSHKKIIDWNNKYYQALFPQQNDIATGAITYSPSIPNAFYDEEAQLEIQGFINAERETQAKAIVQLLQKLKLQKPKEKIAILVRSRTHLTELITELKKTKLDYQAIDIEPLAERQCIKDLFSLTAALLHPADKIAWLSLLRAPWCGLTLNDLYQIAGSHPYATISELLERDDIVKHLSFDGQKRLNKILPILKNKIHERARENIRCLVESTWLLLGGPAFLHDYTDLDDAQAFFNLLEEFNNDLLLNLDLLKEKIQQLYASKYHVEDTLQIMTIHAAKGLEFDTVILPYLERKNMSDFKNLLSWMEYPLNKEKIALLIAPLHAIGNEKDSIYEYIFRQQKIKNNYEMDRLLYVATTRTKKSLYLFFNVEQNEQGQFKIEASSFLEKLWPLLKKENSFTNLQPTANDNNKLSTEIKYLHRFSSSWINPFQIKTSNEIILHKKGSAFAIANINPIAIGIVTHKILQHIAQFDWQWWQTKKSQKEYVYYHLKQIGVLAQELSATCDLVLKAIHNTFADARGRWIVNAHSEAQSEFALTALINDEIKNLVIDRTFIDEEGTRWIIDYKTTTFSQSDLEAFLQTEQDKYHKKMSIYCHAMQQIDDRPIRLGLYFPAIPAWREWEM